MSSSLPSLSQLQEINSLTEQKNNLLKSIEALEHELHQVKEEHLREEEVLREKYVQNHLQHRSLESINIKINELRSQEYILQVDLLHTIEASIQSFLESGKLAEFINHIIQRLAAANESYEILAAPDTAQYLKPNTPFSGRRNGTLRVQARHKSYIFDIPSLTTELTQKITNKLVPTLTHSSST
jgi:hypothetical protein